MIEAEAATLCEGHLEDWHARAVYGLDLRELTRSQQRLECHREVADERLLLGVRWGRGGRSAGQECDIEVCAMRVKLTRARAEQTRTRAGHGPLA
eukprot:scaffold10153_cov65-Phaeocystis_antarctica.AAC.1